MTELELKIKNLYETDYLGWIEETLAQLRRRDVRQLEWEHLIEEVEALGNEQKHKVDIAILNDL